MISLLTIMLTIV
jgi:hypothetical protein